MFIEDWEKKYAYGHLDDKTLETYEYIMGKEIKPYFGDMYLDEIKPIHILNFLEEYQRENEVSTSSIHARYRIIRDILGRAAEWKIIDENPAENVKRP
ncbi:phage integrase SAM-like domain-containing protein [Bacillus atrophaeus]|nr:phage integrase SAM-like domain-containing protein [Bacillus atrophaeus]MCG8398103.1 phage integrase SAM-like domain-containing protein [Bacillus atrophaeus]